MKATNSEGIAIVGLAGRFPGAASVDAFWRNLVAGKESISTFSPEDLTASGLDAAALSQDPTYVPARGILQDAELFDAAFFDINAKQAEITDPQQRLFLEVSWEALEAAGYNPENFPGLIGVFAGMAGETYFLNNLQHRQDLIDLVGTRAVNLGNARDYLALWVAYKLNLRGPALNINTACSTGLVVICQACQSLLTYQCDLALAGSVSVSFPQRRGAHYQESGITSPDGHCRPFDILAQGTVHSDGLGVVALKRLSEALDDGDQVLAVIKGFALNNDGSAKVGFTAPSVDGQAEAIAQAQADAGVDPASISYIECHGTATPIGDPIEIAALTKAFRLHTAAKKFCAVGSVKGNIGHVDAAAGVAGLIKAALALKHKLLPPSLHYTTPNPKIDFADSPFFVNDKLKEWADVPMPRRAGVSSFGLGGTNAHVVLEESPALPPSGPSRPWQLLLISAKSAPALETATANFLIHLKANPELNLADAAFTLQVGRGSFQHRRILVCQNVADAIQALEPIDPKRVVTQRQETKASRIVFMFPGQGSQYVNMGTELYRSEPVFKKELDRCAEILRPHLGLDLRQVLFPLPEGIPAAEELLIQTRITQPALFAFEYALAKLWMSWGVVPGAMIGHSVGEYVAACLAGVFTLEDALDVVAHRAWLVQNQPKGAMVAVRLPEAKLLPLLTEKLSVAAINSPALCVVSGPFDAVEDFETKLKEQGVAGRRLHTSHAFHSGMMDPVLEPLIQKLATIKLRPPAIPYVSNVTGRWVTAQEATDPKYWAGHVRQAVRFADGVGELLKKSEHTLLEVGPGQTLGPLANQHPAKTAGQVVLSSLSTAKDLEIAALLGALGRLWLAGHSVDWTGFYAHEKRRRVTLPTYPFERKRYWVEPARPAAGRIVAQPNTQAGGATTAQEPTADGKMINSRDTNAGSARQPRVLAPLTALFQELSGASINEAAASVSFMELGFDSLLLLQASQAIAKRFGVRVAMRQLLGEFNTLDQLAGFLEQQMPPEAAITAAPVPAPSHASLEAMQAQLLELTRQMEALRQSKAVPSSNPPDAIAAPAPTPAALAELSAPQPETKPVSAPKAAGPAGREVLTLPLSESQMEVWLAASTDPEASCAFNQTFLIRWRCAVNLPALRACLQELVNRHDALRTTFLPDGSGQQIHPALECGAPVRDFSSLNASEAEQKLAEAMKLDDATPFDLAHGPLWRSQVFKISETNHVLLVTAHHVVVDGWSISVLLREFNQLYSRKIKGEPGGLPPAMQYRDFIDWQKQPENRTRQAESEDYWLRQFATLPEDVNLPGDRPLPAVRNYRTGNQELLLGPTLCGLLRKSAAGQDCTFFNYLLASLNVLLHRLTGQADLVIGFPAAGQVAVDDRMNPGSRSLVGHCVNFLPLRNQCEGDSSFSDYLKQVRRLVLDAFEHQEYTLGSLVKKLNRPRDFSSTPLTRVSFNYSRLGQGWQLPEAGFKMPPKDFGFYDLTIEAADTGDTLRLAVRFNSDIFYASTIRRWLGHWRCLLEGMAANPEMKIRELPLLTPDERRQLLVDWNSTEAAYPSDRCLHEIFEQQVKLTPESVAVTFQGKSLRYRELNQRANQLARHLTLLGLKPDDLVGVCLERSLEMVVALLGVLKAGGAYVPLDADYPSERLAFIAGDARPKVMLTQAKLAGVVLAEGAQIVKIDQDWPAISARADSDLANPAGSQNLAYVLYTSGSTGKPKGVQIEHRSLVNFLYSMRKNPGLEPKDKMLGITTLSFDIAGLELWLPLVSGAQIILVEREVAVDGQALAKLVERSGVTVMQATPSTWKLLIASGWQGKRGLKAFCGGEPWSVDLARQLLDRGLSLWNLYGPTETTIWSAAKKILPDQEIVIGPPIANTQIYILDPHLQPVPIGIPGELHIGGDGLARGYLNRPELTAEKFIPNPFRSEPGARVYKTGDLARCLLGGNYEYLGRIDNQVKLRGFRIELGEIEARLGQHPEVKEAVVAALEDASGDKRLVAYVTAKNGEPPLAAELRAWLQVKLPEYMVPAAFVTLKQFPMTPNGKLDRKALPKPEMASSSSDYVAPKTTIEVTLAKMWCDTLGLKQVGIRDNFFDLGGHSLLAIRLITRINQDFKLDLPVRTIFLHPTIAQLATDLGKSTAVHRGPVLFSVSEKPELSQLPLVFIGASFWEGFWELRLASLLRENHSVFFSDLPISPEAVMTASANPGAPEFTLKEMAAKHVALIRAKRISGPIALAGLCFGGMIAFEVAHQLKQAGVEVAAVFVIDTRLTPIKPWWPLELSLRGKIAKLLRRNASPASNGPENQISSVSPENASSRSQTEVPDPGLYDVVPWQQINPIIQSNLDAYRRLPLDAYGFICRCADRDKTFDRFDPSFGAKKLFRKGHKVIEVPGGHHGMFYEPGLSTMAKGFDEFLRKIS